MRITIIGTGYVGLVTGACFAKMGNQVTCLDIDKEKIHLLQKGQIPIYEPGLEDIIQAEITSKRLSFTTSYSKALEEVQLCFVAVPTPQRENGASDLSYVYSAIDSIVQHVTGSFYLVIKSTVPVGTTLEIQEKLQARLGKKGIKLEIAFNPEFLKEGCAVEDCLKPDRIIIGTTQSKIVKVLKQLYASYPVAQDRILVMDPTSAEMTKYAANAMLATRISFMNELACFCEAVGANINAVRIGIGSDSRIGNHFLFPGVGWGGSCFPKDIQSLIHQAESLECPTPILRAVDAINNKQKKLLFQKMQSYFSTRGGLKDKTIAIWGLAFKPNTDDIRKAPSLELIQDLLHIGCVVRVYDPVAIPAIQKVLNHKNLIFCEDEYSVAQGCDAIALVTEWKQFKKVDFQKLKILMRGRGFFDGRNLFSEQAMENGDFDYFCIGIRPKEELILNVQ